MTRANRTVHTADSTCKSGKTIPSSSATAESGEAPPETARLRRRTACAETQAPSRTWASSLGLLSVLVSTLTAMG